MERFGSIAGNGLGIAEGRFNSELDASIAYQNALNKI